MIERKVCLEDVCAFFLLLYDRIFLTYIPLFFSHSHETCETKKSELIWATCGSVPIVSGSQTLVLGAESIIFCYIMIDICTFGAAKRGQRQARLNSAELASLHKQSLYRLMGIIYNLLIFILQYSAQPLLVSFD